MLRIKIWIVKERLRQSLGQRQKQPVIDASRLPSAVLLPIYSKQGQYYVLFIKRTQTVKNHKGEISFPGGTHEEGETLLETALRECTEEIDLLIEDVEILGELDDFAAVTSNYIITPFVAVIPWPYQFKIAEDEVEEIIEIPISALQDKNNLHRNTETENGEAAVDALTYHYQRRVIWGATARILYQFLDIYGRAVQNRQ
ncbi:NUDIX hydrolase [Chloroflexota bacterium]